MNHQSNRTLRVLRGLLLASHHALSSTNISCGVNALLGSTHHHHHSGHHRHRHHPSSSSWLSESADVSRHRRISFPSSSSTPDNRADAAERKLIEEEEQAHQRRVGQAKRRFEKGVRREDRISVLESSPPSTLDDAERAELEGLRRSRDNFEEQYDPESFSEEHVEFKLQHNRAFLALSRYCQQQRQITLQNNSNEDDLSVFFLDGPDGGTTAHLIEEGGLDPSQCYVANRHLSSCDALRVSGGGRLPDENVLHATAAEALSPGGGDADADQDHPSFSDIDFAAYYFDGCGGFVPHIIGMMTAALVRNNDDINCHEKTTTRQLPTPKTTVVGFSLMGGNRDVVEKELEVCRALALIARTRGMTTRHVLDDPERYGIPVEISKTLGGTFTTWILLEAEYEGCG